MSETEPVPPAQDTPEAPEKCPASEDRRRPKALAPYVGLWLIGLVCVIFALIAMLNRG